MASLKASVMTSLGTSAVLFLCASRLLSEASSSFSMRFSFCAVLSTLVSIVLIVTLSRVFSFLIQLQRNHESLTQNASSTARVELLHALDDKWLHTKRKSVGRNPRPLLDKTEFSSSRTSIRSDVSHNSLFEQVKGTLKDHDFSLYHSGNAPIYLMNSATGLFLRITHQRKLAFTSKPNPACLFRVIQSTASQSSWSFCAVNTQRFIGQNLMQKLVATSKKVHAWETFQVLQHLGAPVASEKCSPVVYLLLSAARFGKGMWVADKTGPLSRFSQSSGPQKSKSTKSLATGGELQLNRAIGAQRGVYLSKQFDNVIKFVYSSDLAALLTLSAQNGRRSVTMECEPIAREFVPTAPTFSRSIGTLLQAKDATFHVPMLARWNRGDVRLPWLDAAATNAAVTNAGRTQPFLETPEETMSEIMTAKVPGSTVSDFLEILAPHPIRVRCAIDRSALIKSGSFDTVAATPLLNGRRYEEDKGSYDLLCDWHAHPRYGMIRALCYRADAGAVSNIQRPNAGNSRGPAKSAALNNMKAAIVEQYHSCTIDTDDDPVDSIDGRISHKAALRTKMYTRGIPYSNCFSIEVLMEVEDIPLNEEDAKRRACPMSDAIMSCLPGQEINSALQIRWRASVVFSRHIKLKAQIERGALNGVQSSCASILKLLQKTSARHRVASPGERQNPILNADGFDKAEFTNCVTALAANGNSCSSFIRGTREKCYGQQDLVMLPQTFALEAIKGLLFAIADTNLLSDNLSTLPVQLPWRSFTCGQSSVRPKPLYAVAATVTAVPFFESKPEAFVGVLDEDLGSKVTAALFFEALLSDALSYFRLPHADSGTREVDISAWRAIVSPGQPYKRTSGYIRKQVFRMPLNGIPGVEVARVEDFQYYAFVKAWNHDSPAPVVTRYNNTRIGDEREIYNGRTEASQVPTGCLPIQNEEANARKVKHYSLHQQRLEFGMKLFVPALPGGSLFSIEVLAIVEPAKDGSFDHSLRIYFATPSRNRHPQACEHAVDNRYVVDGISRGLKQIWKQIAQTMTEVCETNCDFFGQPHQGQSSGHVSHEFDNDEMRLLRRLRTNPDLPTHDELASRLVEAIATAYGGAIGRKVHAER